MPRHARRNRPGSGQPIVFSHGWPRSSDDWDDQMLFFVQHGYRVIAHDRRGHGRSSQGGEGHDMDHYADDLAAVTALLDVHDAIHVGHSTGGGEVVRYIARHGESRVAKAVLISAVPPLMVQTEANPGGTVRNYCKGGANAGVSGVVRYYPIDQLDVVVLSNSADGAWPAIDEIHRLIRAENPSVGASGAGFR